MSANVRKRITELTAHLERATTREIAMLLIKEIRASWGLEAEDQFRDGIGEDVLWRGATSWAREVFKRPAIAEALLEQSELFGEGWSEMVCIGLVDGEGLFARRRSLTRTEYVQALHYLEVKIKQSTEKYERYKADYDKAIPYWGNEMTFGEAHRLAEERGAA